MRRIALAATAVASLLVARPAAAIDGDRFGEVTLSKPNGPPSGTVLLFSGADGWGNAETAAAAKLAQDGAMVVGIDSRYYLYRLSEVKEACHVLIGDTEALSRSVQRDYGAGGYELPILAGLGVGGQIAAAALAQSRMDTLAGAVSVGMPAEAPPGAPSCTNVSTLTVAPDAASRGPGRVTRVLDGGITCGFPSFPPRPVAGLGNAWNDDRPT